MTSKRKWHRRNHRWNRYIDQISRTCARRDDLPFGVGIKFVPGYWGPRRIMRATYWPAAHVHRDC